MSGRSLVAFAVVLLHYALQAQTVSFLAHRDIPIGTGCCTVLSGDFNGDGNLDLVVAYGSGSLALLPGDGAGGFKPKIDLVIPSGNLHVLAVAHVDGDGKIDFVWASSRSNGALHLFLGNGDGNFRAQPVLSSPGGVVTGIAVGDLNHDGKLDLVIRKFDQIVVLFGKGDGTIGSYST